MKVEHLKRLPRLLLIAILTIGFSMPFLAPAHASTCYGDPVQSDKCNIPYLKAFGSDLLTGGWFKNGTNCDINPPSQDPLSYYQDPAYEYNGTQDNRYGGILTYTNTKDTPEGGDSSQYAAFSLGEIDDRRGASQANPADGFYSQGALDATMSGLNFANTTNGGTAPLGGFFEGSIRQSTCVPDYYSKKPQLTTSVNSLSEAIAQGNGNYSHIKNGNWDITNGNGTKTISPGERITIYVQGNVYIDHNITYDPNSTVDSVPKFALIVQGSIYIDKGVTELDGMYVAEPAPTCVNNGPKPCANNPVADDTGIIWTCHPDNTAALDYTYPPNCTSPLVVNGALIAKQVNFLRVNGDLPNSNQTEDNLQTVGKCLSGGCNLSEVINYTPAMIMGGSFFAAGSSSGGGSGLPVDSVLSLPPVF